MLMPTMALAAVLAVTPADAGRPVDLANLAGWRIVVSADAVPSERFAASEFQGLYERASGLKLPIVNEASGAARCVFIGPGPDMARSPVGFDVAGFGDEDLRIIVRDDGIAIAGGRPRGTLYGVYCFAEDHLGVRFLTADHTHVPPVGPWRCVGPIDRFHHPPLAMRWSYYGEVNRDAAFAARLRVNTVPTEAHLGGRTGITNINHSFYRQLPSQRYGADHPEYYCLRDGRRLAAVKNDGYDNEPCLMNPEVRRLVTAAVRTEIAAHPEQRNVSVSQNDNDKACRCGLCTALDEPEGTPMGSLLHFVNGIAAAIGPAHPEVQVGTLSYWYTRRPPRVRVPAPNVQIQLCSIEACQLHPISDPTCKLNVGFCNDLGRWGGMCQNISIWNYNTNFSNYLLPCPNLRVIESNVRFFVANHARGMFMQAAGNARGGEMSELRNYLIAGLLWDPARSGDRLVDEFIALHYGRSGPLVRRYIDLVHDTAAASGAHHGCFARRADQYGLDASVAPRALALFEEALAVADDDVVRARVERASIGALRLAIDPVWELEDTASADAELLARMRPLVARFLELCDRHGVDRVSEGTKMATVRDRLGPLARQAMSGRDGEE